MFDLTATRFTELWSWLQTPERKTLSEALQRVYAVLDEAEVSLPFSMALLERLEARAATQPSLGGNAFTGLLHDEILALLEPGETTVCLGPPHPAVLVVVGPPGSGKTACCGKLAFHLRKEGHKPLLVAARSGPAAVIEDLRHLGAKLRVAVHAEPGERPARICEGALRVARERECDAVIVDTAGSASLEGEPLEELREILRAAAPREVLLVIDAVSGPEAERCAREFAEVLDLTGIVLSRLDGDAVGTALLSLQAATGKPIKLVGVGEELEGGLREFRPADLTRRLLGLGDMVAVEVDEEAAKSGFTLVEFLSELRKLRQLGTVKVVLKLAPGLGAKIHGLDDDDLRRMEAIILSMTERERREPEILDESRKARIAQGSGTCPMDVEDLLKHYRALRQGLQKLQGRGK